MARYAGLLLAPAEGFVLCLRAYFCPLGKNKSFHAVYAYVRIDMHAYI